MCVCVLAFNKKFKIKKEESLSNKVIKKDNIFVQLYNLCFHVLSQKGQNVFKNYKVVK